MRAAIHFLPFYPLDDPDLFRMLKVKTKRTSEAKKQVRKKLLEDGIRISVLGNTEGVTYEDLMSKLKEAINEGNYSPSENYGL